MGSHNSSGDADNQQERPGFEQWAVGFVDGEGCFSISVVRNRSARLGWQVQHEFAVAQAAPSRRALEELGRLFGCGRIIEQHRKDNHRDALLRYSVKARKDLVERIIPFFEANPLVTNKRSDFEKFKSVITMMLSGAHLEPDGLAAIASITETMNRRGRSRYLESSEAIRRPPQNDT
jgi:hypothetical protein